MRAAEAGEILSPTSGTLDGGLVLAKDMPEALTAAPLVFGDGATQTFSPDGTTTYVDHGGPTRAGRAQLVRAAHPDHVGRDEAAQPL
jgi:hypothetical protein